MAATRATIPVLRDPAAMGIGPRSSAYSRYARRFIALREPAALRDLFRRAVAIPANECGEADAQVVHAPSSW